MMSSTNQTSIAYHYTSTGKQKWSHRHIHTHTHPFNGPFPGLSGWAGTRKVKPIWILLKQETVSGSGISWAVCKSAPRSRQITTPAPHCSVFYRPDALPAAQPTASKHWKRNDRQYAQKFGEDWTCGFRQMLTDRQTHTHHNTCYPTGAE